MDGEHSVPAIDEKHMTGWFGDGAEPVRPGVYRTTVKDLVLENGRTIGYSYSRWNGVAWERFGGWGDYHGTPGVGREFLWCGLNVSAASLGFR